MLNAVQSLMRRGLATAVVVIGSTFAGSCGWNNRSDWKASISPDGGWCEGVSTDGPDFVADYGVCADGSNGLGFSFKGTNGHLESLPPGRCNVDAQDHLRCPVSVYVSFDGGDYNVLVGDSSSGVFVAFKPEFFGRVLEAKRITFRYFDKEGQERKITFHVAGFPAARRKDLLKKGFID